MALSGAQKAYLQARSGIARSAAIRSNYVFPLLGYITIGGVDVTRYVQYGSLRITQAINDQPDTCSFDVLLTDSGIQGATGVGADVLITLGGKTDNPLFGGRVLSTQTTRGPARTPSRRSVMCADYLQVLDSEYLITWTWPAQPATVTILDMIARFSGKPGGVAISTAAVAQDLPSHASFTVVNEKFSTVLRRLVTAFASGGFYIDPLKVLHVWQGVSEPNVINPQPLTIDLPTLKGFSETIDASQQRDAVIVEGVRTNAPVGLALPNPNLANVEQVVDGIPVLDASIVDPLVDVSTKREVRVGSQRYLVSKWKGPWSAAAGTPQVTTVLHDVAFAPLPAGTYGIVLVYVPSLAFLTGRQTGGGAPWVMIDDQVVKVVGSTNSNPPNIPEAYIYLINTIGEFGAIQGPIKAGATVTNVDSLNVLAPTRRYENPVGTYERVRAQPIDVDVVLTMRASNAPGVHEHLVQDGRYGRTGAANRGAQELADFGSATTVIDWETEDLNAKPGRLQSYTFDTSGPLTPSSGAYMILTSEITWPVWGQPPRLRCHAAKVEPADVVDVWVTDTR